MDNATLLPSLNLVTLISVLALLIGSFVYFLRKRRNREAAARALSIDDPKH